MDPRVKLRELLDREKFHVQKKVGELQEVG